MKHRLILTFIGVVLSIGVMAQSNRTNPDVAKYYIKGNLSIEKGADGKTVYKLSQIDNSGIYFEDPHATRIGEETSLEDVLFQFSRASTDYPGGINTPLDFWRYDNAINEWQPDVETRQGTAGVETKKSMVVMLVLDCSSSLGTDFNLVQGAANSFIRSLYESSKGSGNIKLGVVGFSKINETRVFNIRPLTSDSYYEMTSFINRLSTQNGTALYYAMDKSINELMEEYCSNSIPSSEPLSAAIMVTFTDGLDQTSRNPDKNILTADNYYDEILAKYGTKMQNKSFNGVRLQHEIRGVKGNDIISEAQLGKFRRIGENLGNFKLLNNYSDLGREFEDIAKNLIDQWRILNLYVPNSFSGRVAWTYPGERVKPAPLPTPKTGRNVFLGLNFTLGVPMTGVSFSYLDEPLGGLQMQSTSLKTGISPKFGIDIAWPVSNSFAIGLYFNAGPSLYLFGREDHLIRSDFSYYDEGSRTEHHCEIGFDAKVGILMLVGSLNNKPFIIGMAPCTGYNLSITKGRYLFLHSVHGFSFLDYPIEHLPFEFRFGRLISKHFYLTGNVNIGIPRKINLKRELRYVFGGYDGCYTYMIEPSITLGWHFGDRIKMKR